MADTPGYRSIKQISLLLLSIILLYVSMPNPVMHLPFCVFVAFVPLFILDHSSKGWNRFILNVIFCWSFALLMLIPLDHKELVFVYPDTALLILLFSIVALIYSAQFTLGAYLSSKYGWQFAPLYYGLCWIITQHLLMNMLHLIRYPIETSLATIPSLIQSANIFHGTYMIEFLIIATNVVISGVIYSDKVRKISISVILIMIIHLVNFAYGVISLHAGNIPGKGISVGLIQPNITAKEYYLKNNSQLFSKLINDRIIKMTLDVLDRGAKLIVWPELSGEYLIQNDVYLEVLHKNITSKGAELLIGTSYIDYMNNRKQYNVAFLLRSDGTTTEPHRKMAIFPFVEAQRYSPGQKAGTLPSSYGLGNIGAMICLESTYPRIARALKMEGANTLISISTNASFGNSMISYIHAAQIVFRAIENNLYAVHVGNTGPSVVCDDKGRILTYIPYGKTAIANCVI